MTYRKGGSVQLDGPGAAKKGKAMTEQIGAIAQVPGGLEMLMTIAAEELGGPKGGKTKQLRLYNGGKVQRYQQGGLSQIMEQAQNVQGAGRGDDEMMLHLAPEEFEAITSMWGEPDINPTTGIPEYGFLSKLWKGIKKTVKKIVKSPLFQFIAPIALNIFAPGLGTAIGGWLGATGKVAATIGNTVLRAGIGAAGGGKEGAISGALSGLTSAGVGADIGKKLGLSGATARIAGDALMGGVAGEGTGVGFKQGALGAGMQSIMGDPMEKMQTKLTEMGKGVFDPGAGEFDVTPQAGGEFGLDSAIPTTDQVPLGEFPASMAGGAPPPGPGQSVFGTDLPVPDPSMWDQAKGWMGEHPWLTAGGALAGAGALGMFDSPEEQGPPDFSGQLPPGFSDSLPNLSFDRTAMPVEDYFNYGRETSESPGEQMFFDQNAIPSTTPGGPQAQGGYDPYYGAEPQPTMWGNKPKPIPKGVSGMLAKGLAQQKGWTIDEEAGMMYPPGSFGPASQYAAEGGLMEYKLGGLVRKYQTGGHVRGPGTGRSDDIPAVLSDGEYVIDSESVALLGDGSTDAGARRLDQMREKLRKHKGGGLAKGKFSAAAKRPELYMEEGGFVPPRENPYKPGSARYKYWERKYGDYWAKKEKTGKYSKEEEKKEDLSKDELEMLAKARRLKTRTERELEKLGEKAEGGKVNTSALRELKKFGVRLETAINSGNKKRVKEISSQLRSLDGGTDLLKGFARGGIVSGRKLTDEEVITIVDKLGGPQSGRKFMNDFRKEMRKQSKEIS